jgi:hypothetical protein
MGILLALLLGPSPARAQPDAPYPEAAELAGLVLDSGMFDVAMEAALKPAMAPITLALEHQLRRKLAPEEGATLARILEQALRDTFPRPLWAELYARVLAGKVPRGDARELLRFYRTPLGRKALALSAVLSREGAAAGEELARSRAHEFGQRFTGELARQMPALRRELEDGERRRP